MAKNIKSVSDLTPDKANVNKGSQRGDEMLELSLSRYGAGRSILADKDGEIIAGNKTLKAAAAIGLPVRVVQTDGKELVVVQRTDLDLSADDAARALAIADNRISEISYTPDIEILLMHAQQVDLDGLYRQDEIDLMSAAILQDAGESEAPEERATERDKSVKAVIKMSDVAQFEKAMHLTGKANRAEAFIDICVYFIKNHAKG